jgi:sialic acid synthase
MTMRSLTIGETTISDDSDVFTVAEIGHNHGGSLQTAQHMIVAAAAAGASAVKLQKRDNLALYTEEVYSRPYTSDNSFGATYGAHREALEFTSVQHYKLAVAANVNRIVYFATPFDAKSADDLATYVGVPCFKIASADLVNLDLLRHVAQYQLPILLSTGAGDQRAVDRAVHVVWSINHRLALLQCTAAYPCPTDLLNLRVITTYRERYPEIVIGLSSHYSGISDAIVAYALGARIIEKHLTLDRTSKGSDHAFSLEPAGFAKMCSYLKKARLMLGSGDKAILTEEVPAMAKMREATRWWSDLQVGGAE